MLRGHLHSPEKPRLRAICAILKRPAIRAAVLSSVDIGGFTGLARETFESQPFEEQVAPALVGFVTANTVCCEP